MIKIIVANMSCGHCQIKIKAELEGNDYKLVKFDMNENSILIDTNTTELPKIKKVLEQINYVIDDSIPILDIDEYTIWDDVLDDQANYDQFSTYLMSKEIEMVGFNDDEFGVVIVCNKPQYDNVLKFITDLC